MEPTGYTSREAAGLFGLTPARVRAMARAGILHPHRGPRREYRFSFQDLSFLRSAKVLFDAPLPRRRVHRALRQLVRQLPPGRRPCEVQLAAEDGCVLARDGDVLWRPEDGQLHLDFAPGGSGPVAALAPRDPRVDAGEDWYQHGLDLEPFDSDGARAAYRQAVALSPGHVGARVNLGRLLHGEGDLVAAAAEYRAALESDPHHAIAAFNLGTVLEAAGLFDEAVAAYRLALSGDPALADAHYNLSLLFDRLGQRLASLIHLKRYRELTS